MSSPVSFTDKKAVIARPYYDWEKAEGFDKYCINEGAFFLKKGNRIFIIYSANGCWSDDYCLGLLEYQGGEACNPKNWVKYPKPLFVKGNGVYGVGHASFFLSPDGKETWCAYHCLPHSNPERKETVRYSCVQKISFDKESFPVFCEPAGNKMIDAPSGE